MNRLIRKSARRTFHGQAVVETALVLTLLTMIVASIVEFAMMFNAYMAIQDAARNAARFSSDSIYSYRDNVRDCRYTRDFYRQTACLVEMELAQSRPQITLTYTSTASMTFWLLRLVSPVQNW